MSDMINSGLLTNKAKDLNDRFFLLLNEIVKIFPDAKIKPTVMSAYDKSKTNKQLYDFSIDQMLKLQTEYFMFRSYSNYTILLKAIFLLYSVYK